MTIDQQAVTEMTDARRRLLDAGARIFASQGYSGTGVQQITDAAGANKAMLYYYFTNKDGLYDELLAEGIKRLEDAVLAAEASADTPLPSRLRAFVGGMLNIVAEQPELARIIYREVTGGGESSRPAIVKHFSESIQRLTVVLRTAMESGELRLADPVLSAYSLFGMPVMFISSHFITGRPLDVPVLVEHIVALFLDGTRKEELC